MEQCSSCPGVIEQAAAAAVVAIIVPAGLNRIYATEQMIVFLDVSTCVQVEFVAKLDMCPRRRTVVKTFSLAHNIGWKMLHLRLMAFSTYLLVVYDDDILAPKVLVLLLNVCR